MGSKSTRRCVTVWNIDTKESKGSIIEFDLHGTPGQAPATFKVKRTQHLDARHFWHPEPTPPGSGIVNVLILQDAEDSFSNTSDATAFLYKSRPRFLLYHMSALWVQARSGRLFVGTLCAGQQTESGNVIVIVSADDLRAEGIELSHDLSWEKTCKDFVQRLGSVGKLVTLVTCAHLIVLFGCDGVIYHRGLQATLPMLLFDPLCAEGEIVRQNLGNLPGLAEAFVAGLATKLAQSETRMEEGIEFGLRAARRLASLGLTQSKDPPHAPVYPAFEIMSGLSQEENLNRFSIPSEAICSGIDRKWSILDYTVGDASEVARQIVKKGTGTTISLCYWHSSGA